MNCNLLFFEIVKPRKSNIIMGVIYRHPSMGLNDLVQLLKQTIRDNISKE